MRTPQEVFDAFLFFRERLAAVRLSGSDIAAALTRAWAEAPADVQPTACDFVETGKAKALGFEVREVVLLNGPRQLKLRFGPQSPPLIVSRFKDDKLIDNYWYPRRGREIVRKDGRIPYEEAYGIGPEATALALKEAIEDHKAWLEAGTGPDKLKENG